ncbi:MAG: hypothetical protein ACJ798_03860 [Phenylobacterium sp.]
MDVLALLRDPFFAQPLPGRFPVVRAAQFQPIFEQERDRSHVKTSANGVHDGARLVSLFEFVPCFSGAVQDLNQAADSGVDFSVVSGRASVSGRGAMFGVGVFVPNR